MTAPNEAHLAVYRSETKREAATVTVGIGEVLSGDLHLQCNPQIPEGFETIGQLLNRSEEFYAVSMESDEVALVAKGQTMLVTCERHLGAAKPWALSTALLEVYIASGESYRGWAMWSLPEGHCRALDYLNHAGRFLEVADETFTWYINRAHISRVRHLE